MKIMISGLALACALACSATAMAQVPTGGADAKGNAPLKNTHTVNDGGAKRGATSFTENEARKHIMNAGYDSVSPLTKGKDGVWRGTAMKKGASMEVGLDFKGNVVEAGPADGGVAAGRNVNQMRTPVNAAPHSGMSADVAQPTVASAAAPMTQHHRRHHHMRRHHHVRMACANPGPNGVACSGVDRNRNGVSDKEDRAIKAGAKP